MLVVLIYASYISSFPFLNCFYIIKKQTVQNILQPQIHFMCDKWGQKAFVILYQCHSLSWVYFRRLKVQALCFSVPFIHTLYTCLDCFCCSCSSRVESQECDLRKCVCVCSRGWATLHVSVYRCQWIFIYSRHEE